MRESQGEREDGRERERGGMRESQGERGNEGELGAAVVGLTGGQRGLPEAETTVAGPQR